MSALPAETVLLRCDATETGGIGHLVRCLALAQALQHVGGADVHLSGEVSAPLAQVLLADSGIRLHPAEPEAHGLMALARRVGAGVVHVDDYEGFPDLRDAGRAAGILTSTATDERYGRRDADVIVNGSPTALHEVDPLYAGAAVGLGPRYLALRDAFAGAVRPAAASGELGVLIVMGGTDAAGYGPGIARALAAVPGIGRIGVVGADAAALASPAGGAPVTAVARDPDFRALSAGWDLAVSGAGTTVWELAALGMPMALVGVAENQRDHYDFLVGDGLASGLGFLPDPTGVDVDGFAALVADPLRRQRMAERARALVDGRGARRVVVLWRGEVEDRARGRLSVRAAQDRDAGRLHAWRNDPATRAASRSTDPVAWADHVAWLDAALQSADRRLFVGFLAGEPIGTVRFDRCGQGEWEVSVTVAPAARGRSLAPELISAGTAALHAAGGPVEEIVAEVRSSNAASRRVFDALGYRLAGEDGGWDRWLLRPGGVTADPT